MSRRRGIWRSLLRQFKSRLKLISLAESAIKVTFPIKKKTNIQTALNQLIGAHLLTR